MKIKQKFLRGQLVYIGDMPQHMSHFPNNFIGLIQYSYRDAYGGANTSNYSIMRWSDSVCQLISSAWYEEDQMTLLDNDRDMGEELLQEAYDQ